MSYKFYTFIVIIVLITALSTYPKGITESVMNSNDEVIIATDSIEICVQSFGKSSDPAILLIMGASASMVWWDEEFCQRLADQGRFVIRYDNRDVGRSTSYEPGSIQYNVEDMTDDAIRVLNYFKIDKANLVGMSLGGMIAQIAALKYPGRVSTITMISSSVWEDRPDLPQIDKKILNYHASAANLDWQNKDAVIEYIANGWRLLIGSKYPFDEKRTFKLAEKEVNRASSLLSMFNHSLLKGGESYYGKEKEINIPALVIHGTEDPVLPVQHGEALHESIPGAKLILLQGVGHEMPHQEWNRIIDALIKHTSSRNN